MGEGDRVMGEGDRVMGEGSNDRGGVEGQGRGASD